MKILQIVSYLERGGAETLVLDICRKAAATGLDVELCSFYGGSMEKDFRQTGVPVTILFDGVRRRSLTALRLRKLIQKGQYDIIHCNQPLEAFVAYFANLFLDPRLCMTLQGFIPTAEVLRHMKFVVPRLDRLFIVSKALHDRCIDLGAIKTNQSWVLNHNAIDTDRLTSESGDFRGEFGITGGAPIICMVANFRADDTKDQLTLCKAMPGVLERFPKAYCVLVGNSYLTGSAEYRARCEKYCEDNGVKDRVLFLEGISEVAEILEAADLFVLSSRNEGFPLSVVEAMLKRVPVIVTRIPALEELSENGLAARVVPVGDSDSLAMEICRMLEYPEKASSLAARAFELARERYRVESHIETLIREYEELLMV